MLRSSALAGSWLLGLAVSAFASASAAAGAGAGATFAQCVPADSTLCLQQERFAIQVDWRNPFGPGAGAGHAVALTPDTGFFWFFSPDNLELTLKVIDGRDFNDAFWFFHGSLSNVEFEIRAIDLETGWERDFLNAAGEQTAAASIEAFPVDPLPGDILFVGAHPDDEALVAPILGELCREQQRQCSFLVLTRGENGICRLPGGCLPDLGTVRAAEMANAAAIFGATLDLRALEDHTGPTPHQVREAWAEQAGSDAALVADLRAAVLASGAESVVTLDDLHGSTCHPAHRALGGLLREATAGLSAGVRLWQVETRYSPGAVEPWLPALRGEPTVLAFDANRSATFPRVTAWDYLLADAAAHASQVTPAALAELAALPAHRRRAYLRPADAPFDPRLAALCGD